MPAIIRALYLERVYIKIRGITLIKKVHTVVPGTFLKEINAAQNP